MKYFIFRLRWSQTDSELIIVRDKSVGDAKKSIKANARYIDYLGMVNDIKWNYGIFDN